MKPLKAGISSIGIHYPSLVMPLEELAKLRDIDPNKYLIGLGCKEFSLCSADESIVSLALEAAKRALSRWSGNLDDIGLVAVGTESSLDMTRPLSAWIADELHLKGNIRSYEVKHACYGGTLALKQAIEWKMAGAGKNKAALVIAADISLYAPNDPGEPTQGAGAIAMIVDDACKIAEIDIVSYPWSKPVFDFWRPVGMPFPSVQGDLSLDCYKDATLACHQELIKIHGMKKIEEMFKYHCFHVPFPKMVKKAVTHLFKAQQWEEEAIENYFNLKVDPTLEWNKLSGNSYTASLWISVAKALSLMQPQERLMAFSYGSGCGAELLTLQAGTEVIKSEWVDDVRQDFQTRKSINHKDYEKMREQSLSHCH